MNSQNRPFVLRTVRRVGPMAALAMGMMTVPAVAQQRGRDDGPPADPPARTQAPAAGAPRSAPPPQASPPAAPPQRAAPPPQMTRPAAPPQVIRPAAPPPQRSAPPPQVTPPAVAPPQRSAPPPQVSRPQAPPAAPPPRQAPAAPRSNPDAPRSKPPAADPPRSAPPEVPRAKPSEPPRATPPASRPGSPPLSDPLRPVFRDHPRTPPAVDPPRDRQPKSGPPVLGSPPSEKPRANPGSRPDVTYLPSPSGGREKTPWVVQDPKPPARPPVITRAPDGFDKPLPPRRTPPVAAPGPTPPLSGGTSDRGGVTPGLGSPTGVTPLVSRGSPRGLIPAGEVSGHDFHGGGDSVSVFVGVGVGTHLGRWYCPPPPHFGGCFASSWYYAYPDPFCAAPCHFGPNYWACDPWGSYYLRSWCYWPGWWWYPSCYVRTYPCGTFAYVRYVRPGCDWLVDFRFAHAPCFDYTSCGLISPGVLGSYDPYGPAPLAWSTNGLYKYGWVHGYTVSCVSPVTAADTGMVYASAESLPAPTADLLSTSDRELGDVYMKLGDLPSAIRVYTDHTGRHPGDAEALRSLGIALLESGRAEDGVEQLERAYLIDPTLAERPFPRDLLGERARLEAALDAATRLAATDNTPRAWLAVSVLMQSDGRAAPARSALDKAGAAGLNPSVVEWMRAAMPQD
jgi:Tetratricopeptide repeat